MVASTEASYSSRSLPEVSRRTRLHRCASLLLVQLKPPSLGTVGATKVVVQTTHVYSTAKFYVIDTCYVLCCH